MLRVHFVQADGTQESGTVPEGETVMDCALDNDIQGIRAQCGGACNCCTCHCYIPPEWLALLPPRIPDEDELLAYADDPRANSRLACQITMTSDLDGITVHLPVSQGNFAAQDLD